MVYLIDFFFIVTYLLVGEWVIRVQDCKLRWFFRIRNGLNWIEFLVVLMYLYIRPVHTQTEREASFAIMLTTKIFCDKLISRKRNYNAKD
jgi:hypothetical protein